MKYLYILSRLTVGRWRTACPWGWGNENENCHSDAALPKSDLQIPKALQFWICRFFHAVGITVIATTIRTWSWRTICTWSWRTAPDAMVKPPRSFVFSTFLSGRRSGGTWGASAVRSIFICHSNASAMAPTTLRPITFKKGVPTFHQVWCAWCSFSPKKCHANALENEVYCLLHCPVSSKCCSCHNFPQKCDVNVLEYEVYCLLRSHCFFKYCACHISFQKCAVQILLLPQRYWGRVFGSILAIAPQAPEKFYSRNPSSQVLLLTSHPTPLQQMSAFPKMHSLPTTCQFWICRILINHLFWWKAFCKLSVGKQWWTEFAETWHHTCSAMPSSIPVLIW